MSSDSSSRRTLGTVLLIVGILAVVLGVIYFAVPVGNLPSFMGRIAHGKGHRSKRATAGVAVGALLLIGGSFLAFRPRRAAP